MRSSCFYLVSVDIICTSCWVPSVSDICWEINIDPEVHFLGVIHFLWCHECTGSKTKECFAWVICVFILQDYEINWVLCEPSSWACAPPWSLLLFSLRFSLHLLVWPTLKNLQYTTLVTCTYLAQFFAQPHPHDFRVQIKDFVWPTNSHFNLLIHIYKSLC